MKPGKAFKHPDNLHLKAAEGWYELGNFLEANAELENITPKLRVHPEVLKLRCRIYLNFKSWFGASEIATRLTDCFPKEAEWPLAVATALHHIQRTSEAYEVLLGSAMHFPQEWQIAYNLARYASTLRRFQSAEKWFKKAILLDEKKTQRLGIDDPDLAPLWDSMSTTVWKRER